MRRRTFLELGAAGLWGGLLVGCTEPTPPPKPPPQPIPTGPAPPPPPPRNANRLAIQVIQGRIGTLLYVERLRNHPLGPKLNGMRLWGSLFDGTGIEPMRDFERVFVAAYDLHKSDRVCGVAEHALPPERIRAAMDKLVARSGAGGQWLDNLGMPAAVIQIDGRRSVIAVPTPTLVVVAPPKRRGDLHIFQRSGGLPEPVGPQAVLGDARQPSSSLSYPRVPRYPRTVSSSHTDIVLTPDGGADLEIRAQSTDPMQAQRDAATLTQRFSDAASVKVAILRMQVFPTPAFQAQGPEAVGRRHYTEAELDKLMGMASAIMPRPGG